MGKRSIRYGRVSAVSPSNMTARVTFDDEDNVVSYELSILGANSLKNKDYAMLDVGECVACAFLDNDDSAGFIMGSIYGGDNRPEYSSNDIRAVKFADGTTISYNRQSKSLTINAVGSVNINSSSGDVVINGISLVNHTHGGVMPGGGSTGKPQ